jgi:hypothetical protein
VTEENPTQVYLLDTNSWDYKSPPKETQIYTSRKPVGWLLARGAFVKEGCFVHFEDGSIEHIVRQASQDTVQLVLVKSTDTQEAQSVPGSQMSVYASDSAAADAIKKYLSDADLADVTIDSGGKCVFTYNRLVVGTLTNYKKLVKMLVAGRKVPNKLHEFGYFDENGGFYLL